ncbi:hypothetical protein K502DRAFT_325739 [Neoconidiobolus thromboides FSU 785]|nr:hypothetical protein K502DRAFT_325739 [Neoconidiobolus thromboides FSU 785]
MISQLMNRLVLYNNPQLERQLKNSIKLSELSKDKIEIIEKLLELYQCRPKSEYFDMYDDEAIFEDPICNASNKKELLVQFSMMPKVFPRSETTQMNVLSVTDNELVLDLNQTYYLAPFYIPIPVRSQVRVLLNNKGKIIYHGDYWYHSTLFDKFHGLIGFTWSSFRRLNAVSLPYIAPLVIKLPKD